MALILTKYLPYNFVLSEGITKQPGLDHLVLLVCKTVARMNQFFKVLGKK